MLSCDWLSLASSNIRPCTTWCQVRFNSPAMSRALSLSVQYQLMLLLGQNNMTGLLVCLYLIYRQKADMGIDETSIFYMYLVVIINSDININMIRPIYRLYEQIKKKRKRSARLQN